jgi:hypothetical protein
MFQEGADPEVETVFREMARLTNGAYCRFEPGAEAKLAELLHAVAAFAVGGLAALTDQRTDAARLLLGPDEEAVIVARRMAENEAGNLGRLRAA